MKVYDLEGNEHDKEPVDVAECIRFLGWTTEPPPPKTDESITSENTGSENTDSEKAKIGSKKKGGSTGEQSLPVTE